MADDTSSAPVHWSSEVDNKTDVPDGQAASAIAFRLRERAGQLGINQAGLVRTTGIPKQSIAGYWNGTQVVGADRLFKLSDTLDVSPRWLLTGQDDKDIGGRFRANLSNAIAANAASVDAMEHRVLTEVRSAGAVGFDEMKCLVFGDEPLAPLPLYGSAQGGDLDDDFALTELDVSDVLDYLRRPAALADDQESYALSIVGSSMTPRFKPGERVGVSPRARVEIGDDVIVQLRGENTNRVRHVLIKELVRRNASYIILKQHNPARELRVERSDILAMHKVKGHFL